MGFSLLLSFSFLGLKINAYFSQVIVLLNVLTNFPWNSVTDLSCCTLYIKLFIYVTFLLLPENSSGLQTPYFSSAWFLWFMDYPLFLTQFWCYMHVLHFHRSFSEGIPLLELSHQQYSPVHLAGDDYWVADEGLLTHGHEVSGAFPPDCPHNNNQVVSVLCCISLGFCLGPFSHSCHCHSNVEVCHPLQALGSGLCEGT